MKTVKELMTTNCETVTTQDNIYEVAVKMKQNDVGIIPVVDTDGQTLIGVVTDRDLVVRGYAEKHSGSTSVEKVMTTSIRTASPDMSVDDAAELMAEQQIRRLPVTDNNHKLLGIISIGDLAVRNIFADNAGAALSQISQQHLH
ncbi:CBS domain-containing protein [Paenibacillus sediminis]|uniref:CBS domain-containing protein n=1 Tax=Paenibacillus sediminis TaxID=664909 RepID=A0ABS4GZ61_9BACL|nr:CBS domain-containing protein [Paenibacillus sediminis]MBP1935553.1 CBS domain-containing protein [Paenibacillus sediminis]